MGIEDSMTEPSHHEELNVSDSNGAQTSLESSRPESPLPTYLRWLGFPAASLYGGAVALRRIFYAIGLKKSMAAPLPIISVGNLTAGGTGKTPMTIFIIQTMLKRKMTAQPSVLMRGYGASKAGALNDEALEVMSRLPGVPVFVSPNRFESAKKAFQKGCDVAVMDDGFQHWQLERHINIVLLDATDPFGQGRLLPWGWLREKPKALARADVIVITRCDQADPGTVNKDFIQQLRKLAPEAEICKAEHVPIQIRPLWKEPVPSLPRTLKGRSISVVCALGNPESFRRSLEKVGANIVHTRYFKDHYCYQQKDVAMISKEAAEKGAEFVVVTEKDAVKLETLKPIESGPPFHSMAVAIKITEGEANLWRRVANVLRAATPRVQSRIVKL